MSTKLTGEQFMGLIKQSGLIETEQLKKFWKEFRDNGANVQDPKVLADGFVARNTLTKWQADKLLAGKHKGFFLGKYRLLSHLGSGGMASARAYFFAADGKPKAVGTILRNPEFAATLRALAAGGADAFYTGAIAADIVSTVRRHPAGAGTLSTDDLAAYRVRDVDAVCGKYRAWKVCGMPPSSSGGVAVLQILGALERFDLPKMRPGSAEVVPQGADPAFLGSEDFAKFLAAELPRWAQAVKASGAKLD